MIVNPNKNNLEETLKTNLFKKTISILACFGLAPAAFAETPLTIRVNATTEVNVAEMLANYKNCNASFLNANTEIVDIRELLEADNNQINIALADITKTEVETVTTLDITDQNEVPVKPTCVDEIPTDILNDVILRDLIHARDVDSTGMCMRADG